MKAHFTSPRGGYYRMDFRALIEPVHLEISRQYLCQFRVWFESVTAAAGT